MNEQENTIANVAAQKVDHVGEVPKRVIHNSQYFLQTPNGSYVQSASPPSTIPPVSGSGMSVSDDIEEAFVFGDGVSAYRALKRWDAATTALGASGNWRVMYREVTVVKYPAYPLPPIPTEDVVR